MRHINKIWLIVSVLFMNGYSKAQTIPPSRVSQQVTTIQYFFNTPDPGIGTEGNGAIISITPTNDFTQQLTIPFSNLPLGINNLYVRVMDESGSWSIAERRLFLVDNFIAGSNIVAGEYYIDTDVNGVGEGTPIAISGTDVTQNFAISLPTLSNGIHDLYIRIQSANGVWSIAERRVFLIDNALSSPIVAMEYFFDTDNGVGTGTPIPVSISSDINGTFAIVIPCGTVAGDHQLFVRAQNENGKWSIFERGSFTSLTGIATPVVTGNGPTTFCTGGNVVLSTSPAGSGISYQWFKDNVAITGQTSNSFTATESGSYTIQVSCGSDVSTSTAITVVSSGGGSFVPSIDASNTLVCAGTTVTLTANANPPDLSMTYLWNTNETTQAITVTTGGNYSVTIINGSCVLTTSITLTSGWISSLSAIANPTALCAGNDLNLSTEPTLNISGMDISNYTVRSIPYAPQNLNGAINLIVNGVKNNSFNYLQAIGLDDGIFMGVTLPFSFNFYGIEYNSINISTNGFVQFGQNHNEFAFQAPDINSSGGVDNFIGGPFMDYIFGSSGVLSFGSNGEAPHRKFYINWNGPVLGANAICQSQIVLNETSGIIETFIDNFIPRNNGSEGYTIGVEDISGSLGIAAPERNQTSNLISSPEGWQFSPVIPSNLATYSWTGPNSYTSTDANPIITNAQVVNSGPYSLTITDNLGCIVSATTDNVLITSGQIQTLNCTSDVVVSNDHGLCGATVNYTPTNTGQQASIITYSGNHAPGSSFNIGTTTVTATATNGCTSATCSFSITVNDTEPPTINCPTAIAQCDPVVTFDATATDNCGGNIAVVCVPPSGSTFPVGTTTVLVTATDAAGNTSTCSFNVTIQPMSIQPTSISSSQGNTVCGTTVLTEVGGSLAGGGSYEWKEGSFCGNGTNISNSSTCTTTSENGLHHYFVRIVGATCLNSILCASIPITSTIPQTWYRDADGDGYGNPTTSTNPQNPIMACTQPVGYVLDNTDCDDTRILVHPGYVNAGPDQTKCGVTTATLAGSNPFTGTGTWTGPGVIANSHQFNTTVSGLSIGQNVFRWTVVNGTCGGSDEVIITVYPNPTPTIVGNPTFCFNGSDLLTTQNYLSYAWSANALNSTSQIVSVNTAGTYIVTVTDNNHCTATATKTITRNAPISTTITSPGVFCQGTQSTLGVSSTFSQYHWSNSQNNPTIIISTNGTYSVTVTTAEGCTGTASRTITFLATPIGTIVAGSILNYCNSDSVSLYVTQNFSSYVWNNGDHARFTYITVPGTYTVTYSSSTGCTASTSITKTRLCEEATNFLTTGITKTTAVANWTPPSCSSNGYWLTLNHLTPSWSQVLNVFIQPNTHFTFSSLVPGTQYEWLLGTVCHIDLETHTFGADNRHNFTTLNARETGENGLLQSSFNVFPNPAYNKINVAFSTDKSESFNVRMTDVTGRIVLDVNSISAEGDNQYELDLSSIAKGIYIVSLSKADGVLQTKLVIQ